MTPPRIFTIGHSNRSLDQFLDLLRTRGIEAVVDVRSAPYSRYAPHFNKESLEAALRAAGCQYVYLGRELGGRPEGEEFYDVDGRVRYDRVADSEAFQQGMSRLETGLERYRVAIMCGEESPSGCHRRLLIARVLVDRGIEVVHIRGDGSLQSEAELREQDHEGENSQL